MFSHKKDDTKYSTKLPAGAAGKRGTTGRNVLKEKNLSVRNVRIRGIMKKHAEANPEHRLPGTAHTQREPDLYLKTKEAGLQANAEVTAEGRAIGGEREIGPRLPRCLTQPGHSLSALLGTLTRSQKREGLEPGPSPHTEAAVGINTLLKLKK